jgi:hypothetical protein
MSHPEQDAASAKPEIQTASEAKRTYPPPPDQQ